MDNHSENDMDLGFLDEYEDDCFDLNYFADRPDSLFSFNTVYMDNQDPDIRVIEFHYDYELALYIQSNFTNQAMQSIVKNNNTETAVMCPFFRVVIDGFSHEAPINFKLQTFFKKIGMDMMSPRCTRAMVVGLCTLTNLDSPISVPCCFTTTNVDPMDFVVDDELDLACLNTCKCTNSMEPQPTTLCEVAGTCIPYYVPRDVQFRILSFLSCPTASLIHQEKCRLMKLWDEWLFPMFSQREPRIPCNIASYYNASSVLSTTENATRPYLAPSASLTDTNAYLEPTMSS